MSTLSLRKFGGCLLIGLTAIVLFLLFFIVGLNVAAAPGSSDTGIVAVLLVPFYALAAVLAVLGALFALRKRPHWLPTRGGQRPLWRPALIGPFLLAATTGLGIFLALYAAINTLADTSGGQGWYLPAVACAPLLIVLPALSAAAVFRWSGRNAFGGSLPGSTR